MSETDNELFNINISEDSLRVYLELSAPVQKHSKTNVIKAIAGTLQKLKVSYGLDQSAVENVIEHCLKNNIIPPETLIARGDPCIHKQKEGVKWLVDPDQPYEYQRVVAPDQLLAYTISAPEGIVGKDVYGLPIKPKDLEDLQINVGNGAFYKNEQNPETGMEQIAYYAQYLGIMTLQNNLLTVRPIVKVSDSKLTAQIELFGFLGDDEHTKVNILHILDSLERLNIHYGWDGKLIQTALFNSHRIKPRTLQEKPPERLTIVTGKPPVAGKFGELEWKLDYQSKNDIDRVAFPGQTIASYQCFEEAVPGVDVYGELIEVDQVPENIIANGEGINLTVKDKELYRYMSQYLGVIEIADKVNLRPLLTVTEDKLSAYIELPIYTENRKEISYAVIQKSLEEMKVIFGIQNAEIKKHLQLLNSGEVTADPEYPFYRILVAKGKPARDGVDARLELNHSLTAGKLMEDGSIDFKERSYPWNVKKGDEIGRKIPLVPAVRGIDVFKNRIDAKPAKDLTLTINGITHQEEDGLLFANLDGVLIVNQNNLAVTETFVLSGDVSTKTGNIHTDSTVMVKGVVDPGFKVETKGDIIIEVNIEKASAKAEGNIIVHGGVRGNRSQIEAKGEVNANFMEHADVSSQTNIVISENALDCNFNATDSIIAGTDENRNCSVIGGKMHAFNKISVGELGSSSDIKTFLSVGYTQEDLDRLAELEKDVQTSQKRFDHIENIYASSQAVGMTDEVMMMMAELEPLGKKIEALKEEQTDLKQKIEAAKESVIEVYKGAHPGVSITICGVSLTLNREYKRGKFCLEEGQVVFNSL